MIDVNYGNKIYSELNVKGDYILLKKMNNSQPKNVNGIFIVESNKYKNSKIGVGEVLETGKDVTEKYGIYERDFILYDYYSANGDWDENAIIDASNVIMILSAKEAEDFLNHSLTV